MIDRLKKLMRLIVISGFLIFFLVWVGGCARPTYIRTIVEVKSIAQVEAHQAIPILIESTEQGNRDVSYTSISVLGDFYKELIQATTHKKNKKPEIVKTQQTDIELIEEFLAEYYDNSKNDFNHKNLILQSLSYGLYQRTVADDFFKQILQQEMSESETLELERTQVEYALTLMTETLEDKIVYYKKSKTLYAKNILESFNSDFLTYCEQGLKHPSDRVFEMALSCMLEYANASRVYSDADFYLLSRERISDRLTQELNVLELENTSPSSIRLFILREAIGVLGRP